VLAYLTQLEAEHGDRWPRSVWWSAAALVLFLGASLAADWIRNVAKRWWAPAAGQMIH
jgi:hypothetical protein